MSKIRNFLEKTLRVLFFALIVRPILIVLIGLNVFNHQNLPSLKKQQVILIANHNSHLDTVALMSLFPFQELHKIRPVAASDYFMKNKFVAWFTTTFLNILPIPRSGFTKSNNPLTIMSKALNEGHSLLIFPEGSRGEPEKMSAFKTGIAHLIHKFNEVPVLPVFMRGMGKSLPKGEVLIIPFFCDIVIGEAKLMNGTKEEITEQLEESVKGLQSKLHE